MEELREVMFMYPVPNPGASVGGQERYVKSPTTRLFFDGATVVIVTLTGQREVPITAVRYMDRLEVRPAQVATNEREAVAEMKPRRGRPPKNIAAT